MSATPAMQEYHQRPFVLPEGATEIVLIRHGASAAAAEGRPFPLRDGHGDPPLAPAGREQALRVAQRLAQEPLAGIFITPLCRTAETAAPLAELLGLDPAVIVDLREVHLGEWERGEYRIRMAQGDPLARRVLTEERWDVIPGAEAAAPFARRVRAGLDAIVAASGPGLVAAVLHGGVIAELCRQATGSSPFAFVHVENASLSRLVVFADGRLRLRSFNETAHLAPVEA